MDKSSRTDISIEEQRQAWNAWNAETREARISTSAQRHATSVEQRISELGRTDLKIIEVGCGVGWMCERLAKYGSVTGTDLADEVLERARIRLPHVRFLSGDFLQMDLPLESFDVAVTLETLSHFVDQAAFLGRIADLLKPHGWLMVATQNRPVLERWSEIPGPQPGQIRRWVDARELRSLLEPRFYDIRISSVVPAGDEGWLRIVNSPKLNRFLSALVSSARLERSKERAMFGRTLLAFARRR